MILLRSVLATTITALLPMPAAAQVYPDKPIRIIVPVPAGGTPDLVARMVAPGLSSLLGQQLVMDNRGGAGGLMGAELVARAVPDGYTLMLSSAGPITILPHLQRVPYDTLKDFAAVGLVSAGPYVLIAHPGVQAKTLKELIALAKAEPAKFNYASAGNGAPNHLASEIFKQMAGINITHVPYKGAPQGVTDVLGGHISLNFSSIPPVLQHIKAGRLRALGVSSIKRSSQLPDIPTISDAGVPGYEFTSWFGMLAPAATPKPLIARLNALLVKVVRAPDTSSQFEALGAEPIGSSAEEFGALIRREWAKNAQAVKHAGLRVD